MRAELFRWSDGQYHPNDPAANRVAGALAATAAQGRARLTFAVDAVGRYLVRFPPPLVLSGHAASLPSY